MIAFNINNLIRIINNCAFTPAEVNVVENKFLFSDIVEETLYTMTLVKMSHGNVMKKARPIRGFNPVIGLHNQAQIDSYYVNGLGMNTWIIREDFTQGSIQYVKSHGIFDLGIKKENQTINLCKLDPSWIPVWRAFYTRRFRPEHVTLQNINAFILVITENVRGMKFSARAEDRQQATAKGVKNDEDQYWKIIDHMRVVICERKSIDINDDEVFKVITDLVNGHLILYEGSLGYPQINLLEPNSLPHGDIKQCMKWCLTHFQPKYFSLISGTLKNITRNAQVQLVELKEGGFIRIGIFMEIPIPGSTLLSMTFDLCNTILRANYSGRESEKLYIFEVLLSTFIDMKDSIVESKEIGLTNEDVLTGEIRDIMRYQTNPLALMAITSILMVENVKWCDIYSYKDAIIANKMIESAITILQEIGVKGGDLNNSLFDEWLAFHRLSSIDYIKEFFKGKIEIYGKFIPKFVYDYWINQDEHFKKCFEKRLGTTIEECNARIAAGDRKTYGRKPILLYNCFDETSYKDKIKEEQAQEERKRFEGPQDDQEVQPMDQQRNNENDNPRGRGRQQRGNGNGNSRGRGNQQRGNQQRSNGNGNQQRGNGNGNSRGRGANGRGRGGNGSKAIYLN